MKTSVLLSFLASWTLVFCAEVAAVLVTSEDHQGRSIGAMEAYKRIHLKSLRLRWLIFVVGFVVPPVHILGPILLYPAVPAAVIERLGVSDATKRTYGLMTGQWTRLVMVLVIYFLCLLTLIIGAFFLGPALQGVSIGRMPILSLALDACLLLCSVWVFITLTLAYYDRVEGPIVPSAG